MELYFTICRLALFLCLEYFVLPSGRRFACSATEIFLNYARKSVVGLSFDFLAYNLVAFTCYTVYNFSMLYVPAIRQEYQEMYHQHVPVFIHSFIPLISGGDKRLILLCSRHARYVLYDLPVFYLWAERAASEQSGHFHSLFHFPSYSALYPRGCLPCGVLADSSDHSDRFFQHQARHQLHQVHSSVDVEFPAEVDISLS